MVVELLFIYRSAKNGGNLIDNQSIQKMKPLQLSSREQLTELIEMVRSRKFDAIEGFRLEKDEGSEKAWISPNNNYRVLTYKLSDILYLEWLRKGKIPVAYKKVDISSNNDILEFLFHLKMIDPKDEIVQQYRISLE